MNLRGVSPIRLRLGKPVHCADAVEMKRAKFRVEDPEV